VESIFSRGKVEKIKITQKVRDFFGTSWVFYLNIFGRPHLLSKALNS
jgi:hypothetical protein